MDKINKEEFLKRLKDNIESSNPKELIEYRYPCLVYFKDNYLNGTRMQTFMGVETINFGNNKYQEHMFTDVNTAWELLIKNKNNIK